MSYLDIDNLYKNQSILQFKECYAMEKIHGTSAHITYKDGRLAFFAGGASYEEFVKLFDSKELCNKLVNKITGNKSVTIYGEAYGGKMQGMSDTYGKTLQFVAFEVKIGDMWLAVPQAEEFARSLGFDFVAYKRIPTTLEAIDAERDAPSIQAIKNGCGDNKKREGIVLRPITEVILNNGDRVISKHKRDDFRETRAPRKVTSEKLAILADADEIANEWVTEERLNHILTTGEIEPRIENMGIIIKAMIADIEKESVGETIMSKEAKTAIGKLTAYKFKGL